MSSIWSEQAMHIDQAKSECNEELVRGYLDRELTAAEETEVEAHLEQCPRCRQLISESAAEQYWWSNARTYLKRDDLDEIADHASPPTGWPATGQTDVSHKVIVRQIKEWLDPTDDPKYIGRFGGYEILGVVGFGGMGVVLKGFEPSLNRYVAIKVLSPALATSGAARTRFAREARATAAVLHENVLAIHRVDESHGLPYLVTPFVSGVSLQQRIDTDGPLPLAAILRIGHQVAAGLAAAHAQGLVHRDIKPANILLDRGVDRVTITDFGLARAADDGSLTKTGIIAGTPQYMSPEQARGDCVDQRSDLFSLGSVLYAMCTGHAPFRAETSYGVLRRITDEEPRSIREINPETPEWLCRITARLMSKEPGERFESAGEAAELLEKCLAHVQQPTAVPLPPGPAPTGGHQPPRAGGRLLRERWPRARGLILLAFAPVLLLAGIVFVLEWNKGTLTIESETDDVSVRITQGDTLVEKLAVTQAGAKVRVAAGTYVVEIDGEADGIVVENGTVTLKRGGTEIVRLVRRSAADTSTRQARLRESLVERLRNAEQELLELLKFPVHRIADGETPHVVSPPAPMEVIRELERHEELEKGRLTDLYENNPDDFRIVVEPEYDKVEPPRHLPGIGLAYLHRVRFKCTVSYTEANEVRRKVFRIDADHVDIREPEGEAKTTRLNELGPLSRRVPFDVGATWLQGGDRITIEEVRGTADSMKVGNMYEIRGTYRLASRGKATLSAYITSDGTHSALRTYYRIYSSSSGGIPFGDDRFRRTHERQSMTVERGEGRFRLFLYMGRVGKPHVSFYPEGGGEGFGHVYFGTGDSVLKKGWWQAAGDEGAAQRTSGRPQAPSTAAAPDPPEHSDPESAFSVDTSSLPEHPELPTTAEIHKSITGKWILESAQRGRERLQRDAPDVTAYSALEINLDELWIGRGVDHVTTERWSYQADLDADPARLKLSRAGETRRAIAHFHANLPYARNLTLVLPPPGAGYPLELDVSGTDHLQLNYVRDEDDPDWLAAEARRFRALAADLLLNGNAGQQEFARELQERAGSLTEETELRHRAQAAIEMAQMLRDAGKQRQARVLEERADKWLIQAQATRAESIAKQRLRDLAEAREDERELLRTQARVYRNEGRVAKAQEIERRLEQLVRSSSPPESPKASDSEPE